MPRKVVASWTVSRAVEKLLACPLGESGSVEESVSPAQPACLEAKEEPVPPRRGALHLLCNVLHATEGDGAPIRSK
jgi:hypothetical protein